jgi:hypothetical protein
MLFASGIAYVVSQMRVWDGGCHGAWCTVYVACGGALHVSGHSCFKDSRHSCMVGFTACREECRAAQRTRARKYVLPRGALYVLCRVLSAVSCALCHACCALYVRGYVVRCCMLCFVGCLLHVACAQHDGNRCRSAATISLRPCCRLYSHCPAAADATKSRCPTKPYSRTLSRHFSLSHLALGQRHSGLAGLDPRTGSVSHPAGAAAQACMPPGALSHLALSHLSFLALSHAALSHLALSHAALSRLALPY